MEITERNGWLSQEVFLLSALAAMILLPSCTHMEAWAQTHEREYRAEYLAGGGAVSMTVRPWNPDLPRDWKGVVK